MATKAEQGRLRAMLDKMVEIHKELDIVEVEIKLLLSKQRRNEQSNSQKAR